MTVLARRIRLTLRLLGLGLLFTIGLLLELTSRLLLGRHWYLRASGRALIGWWMRSACAIIGLRIETQCPPCSAPVLMVANHISWLDVLAINAVCPGVFVAKSDVRCWPIIGKLAALSGTRFIQRETLSGLRHMVQEVTGLLERGARVIAFPEGTSTLGDKVMPFSSALLQAPISAKATVQSITLRYSRNGQYDRTAAFIDDDEFLAHLIQLLRTDCTQVSITFGPAIEAVGRKRQTLADYSRRQIVQQLQRSPPSGTAPLAASVERTA